jgi:hypothetical protein
MFAINPVTRNPMNFVGDSLFGLDNRFRCLSKMKMCVMELIMSTTTLLKFVETNEAKQNRTLEKYF